MYSWTNKDRCSPHFISVVNTYLHWFDIQSWYVCVTGYLWIFNRWHNHMKLGQLSNSWHHTRFIVRYNPTFMKNRSGYTRLHILGNTKCERVADVNIVLMGVTTPCVHFLWLCLQLEPCVTRPDLATQDEPGIQKYHFRETPQRRRACWFLDLPSCARPCLFPAVLYCHRRPTKLSVRHDVSAHT